MKELITKIDEYIHHTNDLTREMDNFLIRRFPHQQTYIYGHSITGRSWGIRYPGATRGSIIVDDNNIITDIILDDKDVGLIYDQFVREIFPEYIGMKLVFIRK